MRIGRLGWLAAGGACALPLASVLHPEFSLALKGAVGGLLLLSGLRPLWALAVLATVGPLSAELQSWLGAPPISGNEMLEMLVLAVVCGSSVRQAVRPGAQTAGSPAAWVLAAIFAASAIVVTSVQAEIFAAGDWGARWSWEQITRWYFLHPRALPAVHDATIWLAGLGAAALAAREIRQQPEWGPRLAQCALLGLAGEAVYSWLRLYTIALRAPDPLVAFLRHAVSTRISPHFPDLNAVGSVFALATAGWFTWLVAPAVARRWRVVSLVAFVASAGALWLTQSRAAFVATAVVCVLVWIRITRPSRRMIAGVAIAVLALATLFTVANFNRVSRASAGDAARVRVGLAATGLRMAADHPVFGVGLGEFRARANAYTSAELIALFPVAGAGENAHNQWVQVLGETGIIGLLAFCAYWCGILAAAVRQPGAGPRVPMVALAAGLTALLLSALLGHPFLTPFATLTALVIAGILQGLSPASAADGRRGRWIAAACIAALLISLPFRVVSARRAVDLDNHVVGATGIVGELEGVRFRRAEPESVLFVRTDAEIVEIPLRAESGVGCRVTVSVDGNAADEVYVTSDRWQRARFIFREPETRWNSRRVDVRASGESCQLLIGRVRVIN